MKLLRLSLKKLKSPAKCNLRFEEILVILYCSLVFQPALAYRHIGRGHFICCSFFFIMDAASPFYRFHCVDCVIRVGLYIVV